MPKTSVEYVKQAVPAFLQRFKEETGYKEHQLSDKNRDIDQDKVSFQYTEIHSASGHVSIYITSMIKYGFIEEESQISTNQKRENSASSLLNG